MRHFQYKMQRFFVLYEVLYELGFHDLNIKLLLDIPKFCCCNRILCFLPVIYSKRKTFFHKITVILPKMRNNLLE